MNSAKPFLDEVLATQGLNLIVAIATLMTVVHLRHSHLSDRARSAVDEYLYKLITCEKLCRLNGSAIERHADLLIMQANEFKKRYVRISYAYALLFFSMFFVIAAYIFFIAEAFQPIGKQWGRYTMYAALVFIFLASWLVLGEFLEGKKTLTSQLEILDKKLHLIKPSS